MALVTYISAITEALREEMLRDEKVFIIGEDVGVEGGVFKATKGLYEEFGAERVIDSPLAEGVIVSAAIGSALAGLRPVPEIQFSDFITPRDGCAHPAGSQASLPLRRHADLPTHPARLLRRRRWRRPSITRRPTPPGSRTSPAWSLSPPARLLMPKACSRLPFARTTPSSTSSTRSSTAPSKKTCPTATTSSPTSSKPPSAAPGKDLTLVTYGWTLQLSLQAAEKVHAETGAEIEVVDLRVLNPLDKDTFLESLAKTGRMLIVHEDHRTLGIGAEISAIAAEQAFDCLDAPIVRLTAPDVPAIPFSAPLEKFYLPSVDKIVDAATKLLNY